MQLDNFSKFIGLMGLLIFSFYLPGFTKKNGIVSLRELSQFFVDPPPEFRPMPFWVWNEDMTMGKITEQLQDFKEKGFGGVFIHPRPGLITPYLSKEWLSLFKEAVALGRRLNLKIWIYDENSYPSGFAGGLVPEAMPEASNLGLKARKIKGEELAEAISQDMVCLLKEEAGKFIDLTEAAKSGQKSWPEGNYWLLELNRPEPSPWYGGFTYVDLMRPGVTQTFLRITLEAYKKICGSEFGRTVPGTFQDEAHIGPPGNSWTVNFTPALFEEFSKRWGYDLKTNLPSLFEEVGNFLKVRHDFYLTCLELFIENWARPYFNYCQKNNLQLTGHYWEHDWPRPRLVPDNMALYAYAHIPGIDILMNEWSLSPNAQFGNARAVKEIRSVANQLGRRRTLSETYGASGWDLTFFDQKRIGDWEYALGVNLLNQHLSFSTIKGARKRDHPLSFSYHEPWWPAYPLMNDYFARLSLSLSSGEQINRVVVIEPTTSAWMYYSPVNKNENFLAIATNFQNFLHELERLQVEYDLASELIIKDYGQIKGKKFRVGQRYYDIVILPPGLENLEPWTVALVKEFLEKGGSVISWADKEIKEGGRPSPLLESLKKFPHFKDFSGQPVSSLISSWPDLIQAEIKFENLTGEEKLFHHRRQFNDGQLLFLANISDENVASGEVRLKGQWIERWDALSGRIEPYPAQAEGEWLSLDFFLNPGESLLLAIYKEKRMGQEKKLNISKLKDRQIEPENIFSSTKNKKFQGKGFAQIELRPKTIKRLDPNVLVIDFCDLILGDRTERDLYFYEAQKKTFLFHGFERNPWDSAVQFKDSLLLKNKFPPDSGFRADFHLEVASGVKLNSLKLVVERPEIFKVAVNGQRLEPGADSWWLDKNFGIFDLSQATQEGHNLISLMVSPFSLMAELEPIYILGDFAVEKAARGFVLKSENTLDLGSWKDQGLPFYGHRVLYEAELDLTEDNVSQAEFYFQAPNWQGALAELVINGKKGQVENCQEGSWSPHQEKIFNKNIYLKKGKYQFQKSGQAPNREFPQASQYVLSKYDLLPISGRLKPGKNVIQLIIYGTLRNTLGPHHLNPPRGRAWPLAFQQAPQGGQPPGHDYSFLDYGLFAPFQVRMIKK